jgi:hypothetical protein
MHYDIALFGTSSKETESSDAQLLFGLLRHFGRQAVAEGFQADARVWGSSSVFRV